MSIFQDELTSERATIRIGGKIMARKFYVITRLYNVNDRLASLYLSNRIDSFIDEGHLPDFIHNYLPYRDSNAVLDPNDPNYGQNIFDLDVQNMRENCSGIIGNFDGVGYDSGCAFEVGFAYSLGYPVNLITTDYMRWSVGDSEEFYTISKLMEHVANVVDIREEDETITGYQEQQEDLRDRNIEALKVNLINDFGTIKEPVPIEALPIEYDFYLDPNFKYTESGRNLLNEISAMITSMNKTYIVGDNQGDIEAEITRFRSSGQSIMFVDPFEPNVDSGILGGLAYGIGRPAILYCSNMQHYNDGYLTSFKNLMCRYGAASIATSLSELETQIQQLQ